MTPAPGDGLAALVRRRSPLQIRVVEDRWATLRHVVEAVAIVAAGLWAFYVFIYQERLKPAAEPAAISVSVEVARIGRDARRDILNVTTSFHNVGKSEIDVAADACNVWGERYGDRVVRDVAVSPSGRIVRDDVPQLSSTLVFSVAELRDAAVRGRRGMHIVMQAGDTESLSYLVVVPRGQFDVIRAQAIVVPVKTSLGHRAAIAMTTDTSGAVSLAVKSDGLYEDDTETDFALVSP